MIDFSKPHELGRPGERVKAQRLYSSGFQTVIGLNPQEIPEWVEYNRKWRPGCSLYIDGRLVHSSTCSRLRSPDILPPRHRVAKIRRLR